MMKRLAAIVVLVLLGGAAGCNSHIVPLRPVQKVEVWVPDAPAQTGPAATTAAPEPAGTAAATTAAAPEPATQPGHMAVKTVDPNQSARFIYNAGYDNVWKQALEVLTRTGFAIDRQDYRLGAINTLALPSAQIVEFWKPQQADAVDSLENTINNQRRLVRLTISTVEGKPMFYEIAVQVLVERETNPGEAIGGPVFVEGSGFGRNAVTLRSDYAAPKGEPGIWTTVGHDPDLERKLLDALFRRI
jgi:hypothetical protein